MNGVAVCLENGLGRKRDERAARQWFEKAADAGSLVAMRNLARHADRGIGGRADGDLAARWLQTAFTRGHDNLLDDFISYPWTWSRDTRRALQQRLKSEGHFTGALDGQPTSAFDHALWRALPPPEPGRPARLLQEFVWVPAEQTPRGLLVRVCKRPGDEARPLVVVNHGLTTVEADRRETRPSACGALANFFAAKGYNVAFPLRRGYGETGGRFVEGGSSTCSANMDFVGPGLATAADIQRVVEHLSQRSDIQPRHTLVVGHSGGGWGALALASRNPAGIIGYVNLSGGHGSRRGTPEGACGPGPLVKAARAFGRTAQAPTLWIYAENDSHIGPRLSRALFAAYQAGGGKGAFVMLPPYDDEGHNIFDEDGLDLWGAVVERWLKDIAGR
jgi:pimeloyl-ACP methyl ester carboxylesterase